MPEEFEHEYQKELDRLRSKRAEIISEKARAKIAREREKELEKIQRSAREAAAKYFESHEGGMPKNAFQRAWRDYFKGSFSGYTTLTEWYCVQLINLCAGTAIGLISDSAVNHIGIQPEMVYALSVLPLMVLALLSLATVNRRMRSIWGRSSQSWVLLLWGPIIFPFFFAAKHFLVERAPSDPSDIALPNFGFPFLLLVTLLGWFLSWLYVVLHVWFKSARFSNEEPGHIPILNLRARPHSKSMENSGRKSDEP